MGRFPAPIARRRERQLNKGRACVRWLVRCWWDVVLRAPIHEGRRLPPARDVSRLRSGTLEWRWQQLTASKLLAATGICPLTAIKARPWPSPTVSGRPARRLARPLPIADYACVNLQWCEAVVCSYAPIDVAPDGVLADRRRSPVYRRLFRVLRLVQRRSDVGVMCVQLTAAGGVRGRCDGPRRRCRRR